MKIVGCDPSLSCIGWCLYDSINEAVLDYGIIKPLGKTLDDKLSNAYDELTNLFDQRLPVDMDTLAIETPIVARNVATTMKLAYLGGVLRLAAYPFVDQIVPVLPQSRLSALALPVRMKRQSAKTAVLRIVNQLYPELDLGPKDHDIADAVAISIAAMRKLKLEEPEDG